MDQAFVVPVCVVSGRKIKDTGSASLYSNARYAVLSLSLVCALVCMGAYLGHGSDHAVLSTAVHSRSKSLMTELSMAGGKIIRHSLDEMFFK